jgi:UDPglucose--hexose-1-phosphate uridylyltransferase
MSAIAGAHRRYNPLLDEWVLCSPHRLSRPWQGQVEARKDDALPPYDPSCYLCPGNARAEGAKNPNYTGTFAFDNDFPALRPETSHSEPQDEESGLLRARPESGRCRVLCFSPRHDLTLAGMDVPAIRRVIDAWADEVRVLGGHDDIRHVQVFENKGAAMGCSNPHPHGQVWANASVPTRPARMLTSQERHLAAHGRDLLGEYLEEELRRDERVVEKNAHWVALVPFWAVWPYETMLLPRRRVPDLQALSDEERDALAEILKPHLVRYDNLFGCSMPYTMGWQGRPTDGGEHPSVRLHAAFFPPLLRSATVRKFLVGYEMTAEAQRDLTPEEAAARLRDTPSRARQAHAS